MGHTDITVSVALEVLHHEAIVRQAYYDSVGVLTWSAGITNASGHNVERYIRNPQPMRKCLEVYIWLLEEKYAPAVRAAFKGYNLTEGQFAAALSFHWNTGAITRATWVKEWKAGQHAKSRNSFMNWRKPASIIKRREAERDLFFDGKWSNTGMTGEYTEVTSRLTPVWSSRRNVDVKAEVMAILRGDDVSRETPAKKPAPQKPSGLAALFQAIMALFRGRK